MSLSGYSFSSQSPRHANPRNRGSISLTEIRGIRPGRQGYQSGPQMLRSGGSQVHRSNGPQYYGPGITPSISGRSRTGASQVGSSVSRSRSQDPSRNRMLHPEQPVTPAYSVVGASQVGRYQQDMNSYRREASRPPSSFLAPRRNQHGGSQVYGEPPRPPSAFSQSRGRHHGEPNIYRSSSQAGARAPAGVHLGGEHKSVSQVGSSVGRHSQVGRASQVGRSRSQVGRGSQFGHGGLAGLEQGMSQLGLQQRGGSQFMGGSQAGGMSRAMVKYDSRIEQAAQVQSGALSVDDEINRRRAAAVWGSLQRDIEEREHILARVEEALSRGAAMGPRGGFLYRLREDASTDINFLTQRLQEYGNTLDLYDRAAGMQLPRDTSQTALGSYDAGQPRLEYRSAMKSMYSSRGALGFM